MRTMRKVKTFNIKFILLHENDLFWLRLISKWRGGGSFYIFGKNASTMNVMYQVEAMLYISNHESLSGAQTADGISCNGE